MSRWTPQTPAPSGGGALPPAALPTPSSRPTVDVNIPYFWVGALGLAGRVLMGIVCILRLWQLLQQQPRHCKITSKRTFHLCVLLQGLCGAPLFFEIIVVGEFNLLTYAIFTVGTVSHNAAVAVIAKEWFSAIKNLQHLTGQLPRPSEGSKSASPLLGSPQNSWGKSRFASLVAVWPSVYVGLFVVLALISFTASLNYDLLAGSAMYEYFDTTVHNFYILVSTLLEALLFLVLVAVGVMLRKSLFSLITHTASSQTSQERIRKTLFRISAVVFICTVCSVLRVAMHVRSLFSSKEDPQWIGVFSYYLLYETCGQVLPTFVLLLLMRTADRDHSQGDPTGESPTESESPTITN